MNNHKKNSIKHMLMMALCCGLPILIISIIPFLGASNTALKTGLVAVAPFLCPIMMVGMMFMMRGKNHCCHDNHEESEVKKLN